MEGSAALSLVCVADTAHGPRGRGRCNVTLQVSEGLAELTDHFRHCPYDAQDLFNQITKGGAPTWEVHIRCPRDVSLEQRFPKCNVM